MIEIIGIKNLYRSGTNIIYATEGRDSSPKESFAKGNPLERTFRFAPLRMTLLK